MLVANIVMVEISLDFDTTASFLLFYYKNYNAKEVATGILQAHQ